MRLFHGSSALSATFDDPNLVSVGGLVPVVALAQSCRLGELVGEKLTLRSKGGVKAQLGVPRCCWTTTPIVSYPRSGRGMSRQYRKFSPEFRDDAVRLVIDSSRPIAQVARELGVNEVTLGNWVNAYRKEHAADKAPLDVS